MSWEVRQGDVLDWLREMPDGSVHCCVTSPPYWGLRDYGVAGQLGLEPTPEAYVARMVEVFREVRRVLRDDGTLFLNVGDSYATGGGSGCQGASGQRATRTHTQESLRDGPPPGLKPKDLVGIPWRLAFALQADGWYLRSDIIWSKPNPMPESVTDRPTKAHEYVFLLAKSQRYYYDAEAVKEASIDPESLNGRNPRNDDAAFQSDNDRFAVRSGFSKIEAGRTYPTRNRRTVWTIATQPYPEAHFATYPEALVEPCIKAGCPEGGTVLDPFSGSGTTGAVAVKHGRNYIGIELNPAYIALSHKRIGMALNPSTWRDENHANAAPLFQEQP